MSTVEYLNICIQIAAWESTSIEDTVETTYHIPEDISEKIAEKKKPRKKWQETRCPKLKTRLNYLIKISSNHSLR